MNTIRTMFVLATFLSLFAAQASSAYVVMFYNNSRDPLNFNVPSCMGGHLEPRESRAASCSTISDIALWDNAGYNLGRYPVRKDEKTLKNDINIVVTPNERGSLEIEVTKSPVEQTALYLAAERGEQDRVRYLLKQVDRSGRPLDLNKANLAGWTPLMAAARSGHVEIVADLLRAGADIDQIDNDGKNALMLAVVANRAGLTSNAIFELINARINVNVIDRWGDTALIYAAWTGSLDVVQTLLAFGADFRVIDNTNYSALDRAIANDHRDVAKVLVEAGATTRSNWQLVKSYFSKIMPGKKDWQNLKTRIHDFYTCLKTGGDADGWCSASQ